MHDSPPDHRSVMRPEDMLEDAQDVRVINGVEVRKGTLGAFMVNARRLAENEPGSDAFAELASELRRLAPAVRALGVIEVFAPRSPALAEILEDSEAER